MNQRSSEVIGADTVHFEAECPELYEAPNFGSFVRAESDGVDLFGVVYHIATGCIEPSRGNKSEILHAHARCRFDASGASTPSLASEGAWDRRCGKGRGKLGGRKVDAERQALKESAQPSRRHCETGRRAPIFLGPALHCRGIRVLHFEPVGRAAGTVR